MKEYRHHCLKCDSILKKSCNKHTNISIIKTANKEGVFERHKAFIPLTAFMEVAFSLKYFYMINPMN